MFLLQKASKTILDYSYRVPDVILQKAKKLINTVRTRQYKDFKVSGRQGQLLCLSSPTIQDILELLSPDKSIFFLFRTNFLAKTFVEKSLIPHGIPYWTIRHNTIIPEPWTYKLIDIRNAMVKIKLNQKLNENEVFWLLKISHPVLKYIIFEDKTKLEIKIRQALYNKELTTKNLFKILDFY